MLHKSLHPPLRVYLMQDSGHAAMPAHECEAGPDERLTSMHCVQQAQNLLGLSG